ncbi:MAG: hypothetical protein AAGI69_29430 [Cyanobacteria bacterium P01_H01_bin.21]
MLTPTETAVLWGLHHPYWLLAIAITLVIVLQLSVSVISQLLRRSLKWLGRSPFSLGRWLLNRTSLNSISDELKDPQLSVILTKLEILQQEQETLLSELKLIMRSRSTHQDE